MSNSLHIKRDALAAAYARRTPEQLKDIIHKYEGIIEIGNASSTQFAEIHIAAAEQALEAKATPKKSDSSFFHWGGRSKRAKRSRAKKSKRTRRNR
jgi:hypothetical protein